MNHNADIRWNVWPLALLVVVGGGCGNDLPTVPAQGVVTFNGAPVEAANVAFFRDGEQGPAAIAVTDAQGRFELKTNQYHGAMPGRYAVTVQKDNTWSMNIPDPLPAGMTKSSYMRANNLIPQSLLPAKYSRFDQTPFHVEVAAEANKNHFALTLEGIAPASSQQPAVGRPIE